MPDLKPPLCQEEAFNSFFNEHARALRNYLYFRFGDAESVDDVVQESFIQLWKHCAKVTLKTAKAYLFKIGNNLSTSLKRHEKVRLNYQEHAIIKDRDQESPEYLIMEKEYMEKLTGAIAGLPDRQREVFLLNRIEKKTYVEIAEMSGVSVKAIEKLMHKALMKLRNEIGDL